MDDGRNRFHFARVFGEQCEGGNPAGRRASSDSGNWIAVRVGLAVKFLEHFRFGFFSHNVLPAAGFLMTLRPSKTEFVKEKRLGYPMFSHHRNGTSHAVITQDDLSIVVERKQTLARHTLNRL